MCREQCTEHLFVRGQDPFDETVGVIREMFARELVKVRCFIPQFSFQRLPLFGKALRQVISEVLLEKSQYPRLWNLRVVQDSLHLPPHVGTRCQLSFSGRLPERRIRFPVGKPKSDRPRQLMGRHERPCRRPNRLLHAKQHFRMVEHLHYKSRHGFGCIPRLQISGECLTVIPQFRGLELQAQDIVKHLDHRGLNLFGCRGLACRQ